MIKASAPTLFAERGLFGAGGGVCSWRHHCCSWRDLELPRFWVFLAGDGREKLSKENGGKTPVQGERQGPDRELVVGVQLV